ncbi:MAG: hypothetical protein WA634_09670 [Silvibacterium sp.]
MKFLARLASCAASCGVLCALFFPIAHAAQNKPISSPAVFPALTTYNLDKAKLNLPSDFAAPLDLLLISFRPEQQTQINTWMPVAQALQHTNFNFRWYRMPASSQENFVFRWWDNASMRSDETDPETYPWIVPLYVDLDGFRRSLQIPNVHQVAIRLVNKQGRVLWSADGPMTPAKRDSLAAAVVAAAK